MDLHSVGPSVHPPGHPLLIILVTFLDLFMNCFFFFYFRSFKTQILTMFALKENQLQALEVCRLSLYVGELNNLSSGKNCILLECSFLTIIFATTQPSNRNSLEIDIRQRMQVVITSIRLVNIHSKRIFI